jgi:hypothetical protein
MSAASIAETVVYCDKYGIAGSVYLNTLPATVRFGKALSDA